MSVHATSRQTAGACAKCAYSAVRILLIFLYWGGRWCILDYA